MTVEWKLFGGGFEDNDNFTLSPDINGPVLAAAIILEEVLILFINLFVLSFTCSHCSVTKQPSVIFLTNFLISNIVLAVLFLPFSIVTAIAGRWIIGASERQLVIMCHLVGFVYTLIGYVIILTLTALSVDRWLFITRPLCHKAYMKNWVAVVISVSIWVTAIASSIPPFFGFGQYSFEIYGASCFTAYRGHTAFLILSLSAVGFNLIVTTITTLWTYFFSRKYVKKFDHDPLGSKKDDLQSQLYEKRKRKLTGIFITVLVVTGICYGPIVLAGFVGIFIQVENLPGPVFTASLICLYSNAILNPIIQSYFRKDLNEFIVSMMKKAMGCCKFRNYYVKVKQTEQ